MLQRRERRTGLLTRKGGFDDAMNRWGWEIDGRGVMQFIIPEPPGVLFLGEQRKENRKADAADVGRRW